MDDLNTNNNIQDEVDFDVIRHLDKKSFFRLLNEKEIDLDEVVKKKKNNNVDFHRFNILVRNSCDKNLLNIIDIAVYINTDYFKENGVLECFDAYNLYELKCELSDKFGITRKKSVLSRFLGL